MTCVSRGCRVSSRGVTRSPRTRLELCRSTLSRVLETTYFGIELSATAM